MRGDALGNGGQVSIGMDEGRVVHLGQLVGCLALQTGVALGLQGVIDQAL